ncbi:MAG: hypothetical protein KF878_01180 [Planctomycetes bacterium]|nr:hypothetical protein [Planctomycetota bacterium]MCW8138997.1 hypothetical protein [Planctomycetota bacterium]
MSTFRKLLLIILMVTHLLVGGGALVSCIEQDGGRATELALSLCCERAPSDQPSAPAPSITPASDDCGACVDELLSSPAARPCNDAPCVVIAPASLPDAIVELELPPTVASFELAALPPDMTPRRMRPAQLRP